MFKEALCYFVTTAERKVIPLKLFYYQTIFKLGIINIHYTNIKKME